MSSWIEEIVRKKWSIGTYIDTVIDYYQRFGIAYFVPYQETHVHKIFIKSGPYSIWANELEATLTSKINIYIFIIYAR